MKEYLIYYIYLLRNPIDNSVFYIGKTRCGIQLRFEQHISESKATSDKPYARKNLTKNSIIREILRNGLKPELEIIETLKVFTEWDSTNCSLRELMWMEHYRSLNEPIVNIFGVKRKHRPIMRDEWKDRQCYVLKNLIDWHRTNDYYIENQYNGEFCINPLPIKEQLKIVGKYKTRMAA